MRRIHGAMSANARIHYDESFRPAAAYRKAESVMAPIKRDRPLRTPKRGDTMVEEIKKWIVTRQLTPGERLPKEADLQTLFTVSKGTVREALKSLEVQGFVTMKSGPEGGATIVEVPFDRTFQLMQNYLFFKNVDIDDIYAMRRLLEPELVAGAVAHLQRVDLKRLESSIEICAPAPLSAAQVVRQRAEDLHFHDLIAEANPNPFLRFMCQLLNEMLRRMVALDGQPMDANNAKLGKTNVAAHRAILAAIQAKDVQRARSLMLDHIVEAEGLVKRLHGAYQQRLVLDSDMRVSLAPPKIPAMKRKPVP